MYFGAVSGWSSRFDLQGAGELPNILSMCLVSWKTALKPIFDDAEKIPHPSVLRVRGLLWLTIGQHLVKEGPLKLFSVTGYELHITRTTASLFHRALLPAKASQKDYLRCR